MTHEERLLEIKGEVDRLQLHLDRFLRSPNDDDEIRETLAELEYLTILVKNLRQS